MKKHKHHSEGKRHESREGLFQEGMEDVDEMMKKHHHKHHIGLKHHPMHHHPKAKKKHHAIHFWK